MHFDNELERLGLIFILIGLFIVVFFYKLAIGQKIYYQQYIPFIRQQDHLAKPLGGIDLFYQYSNSDLYVRNDDGYISRVSKRYYVDSTEIDQGRSGKGNSVKDLVDAIGTTTKATLYFIHSGTGTYTDYTFTTAETVSSNITIIIENGARLKINNCTVTINSSFEAGLYECINLVGTGALNWGNGQLLKVAWLGADPDASTATNYNAIANAITAIKNHGSGSIFFDELYNVGANGIIIDGFSSRKTLLLKGNSSAYYDQQTTIDPQSGSGILSSATTCIQFGSDTADFQGRAFIEDFTIIATDTNQIGIDFKQPFASGNMSCDMDNVRLLDFEGINAVGIDQGRCVDATWNNIKIFGKGTQCGIGIDITRECPTLISPIIIYCLKGLYLSTETSFIIVHGGWLLYNNTCHIVFKGGVTYKNPSAFFGTFIGESQNTDKCLDVETTTNTNVYVSFFGCHFDSKTSSGTEPIIDFDCGGVLTLIGCINYSTSDNVEITLSQYSRLISLGNKNFDLTNTNCKSIFNVGQDSLAKLGVPFSLTPLNLVPTFTRDKAVYLDDGTNTWHGQPGFRAYSLGSASWFDMATLVHGTTAKGADAAGTNVFSANANQLAANTGFLTINDNSGNTVYIPYWTDITP